MQDILEELKKIRDQEIFENANNIYVRTLSKLLRIERDGMYQLKKGNKAAGLEKVINEELKKYMDEQS